MAKIIRHDGEVFHRYDISEIYQGQTDNGTYHVPNVNDEVVDKSRGIFRVIGFSDTDQNIALLSLWFSPFTEDGADEDLNAGLSRNYARNSNRAFFDNTGRRNLVIVDRTSYIYDPSATKARLFRGTDTSEVTGEVISRVYDSNDQLIGDTVSLINVFNDNGSIKIAPAINVDVELETAETVTLVCYNPNSGRVYEEQFKIRKTSALRGNDTSNKYVTSVELVTPYLSSTEDDVLIHEVGVAFASAAFECKINYSDGSSTQVGIDGVKTKLVGIEGYNTNILGFSKNVVLYYFPDSGENAINMATYSNRPVLEKVYRVINRKANTNISSFKVYAVPRFINISDGYSLRYYLTNDEYSIAQDVTDYINVTKINGSPVSTIADGQTQELMFLLRIKDVIPAYPDNQYHHQYMRLTLNNPTTVTGSAWLIDYPNDGSGHLGEETRAVYTTFTDEMDLTNGLTTLQDWLDLVYREAYPAYDDQLSNTAPEPTHFSLFIPDEETETPIYSIGNWSNKALLSNNIDFSGRHFKTVVVSWKYYDSVSLTYKQLAYTPMLIEVR